jgi:hypothetical protein
MNLKTWSSIFAIIRNHKPGTFDDANQAQIWTIVDAVMRTYTGHDNWKGG